MSLALLHSPGNIIRWLIINLGQGTDPQQNGNWPVYWNSEPDTPDNVITVYDTTGILDGRSQIDGEVYKHSGFQVRVRAPKARQVYNQISTLVQQLNENVKMATVGINDDQGQAEYIVCACNQKSDIIDMKKESPTSERSVFVVNYTAAVYRIS